MKLNSLLILSASVLLFASCGNKAGKSGLMVPKDASIVVHINSASLSSKLTWEEIRQTNWFNEMSKEEEDTLARQLLKDPATSGVDTKGDLVFYMKKRGRGGYLVFQGKLNDPAAFEKLLKELKKHDGEAEVKKDGDFSYMTSHDGVVIWNKSDFSFVANAPMPDMKNIFDRGNGMSKRFEFMTDSLKIFGQESLTLKSDDNLDKDSRFANLVKDGSDVHFWFNAEGYYGSMGAMMSMMKISELFKGNVSAVSLNFDNGKITAKSKTWYGEEMSRLLDKYKGKPISADMINRIPSGDVAAVMAFNYPPEGLMEFLKVVGVDGMANSYLSQMNYSVEELLKAVKGDILISVSDITMKTKTDTLNYGGSEPYMHTSSKPDMKILFATSVKDKASFEKLISLVSQASKGFSDKMPAISSKLTNDWFVAGNSAEQTDKFIAGGNSNLPFVSKITGHPFGMYVDLQKIVQSVGGSSAHDSASKAVLDASLKMWQDVVASGGDFSDKSLQYSLEINMVDKNTNSLKQLNQYIDKLAMIKQAGHKKDLERISIEPAEPAPAEK